MKTKLFLILPTTLLLGVGSFAWQQTPPAATGTIQTKPPAKTAATARTPSKPKPAKPPWQQFKLNPKSKLFLDFTDSNPDMILSIFSRTSGITILKDPSFKTPLTVTSAKSVGLNEAFEILNTVLEMHQHELQKKGNLLVVAKKAPPAPPMQATPPPQPQPQEEKIVLKVYHLKNAGSQAVAKVINEVYSQQALEQMVQQLQQGGGFGGPPMGMMGGMPGRPQPPKVVRASSDEYSNAVVVNAPEKFQPDIEKLVQELDKTAETPLSSEIFRLKHVAVDEVIDAIQDVLAANAPTGRGARRTQENNNPFMGYYNPFASQRSSSSGNQTAVMVKQTNSIIVSATPENLETIRKLIKEMDSESGYVGTTFVVKLENAKATDVAALLNQAFTERRNGQNDNPFFIFYSDMFDSNRNKSEIKTDITDDGRLVNVRDLTGKVNIMADPNTNSLIIVTLPSNMKLIQGVIDQIDQVSEQVMIETVIVEANLDKSTKLGVEFSFLHGSGNVSNAGSSNFGLGNAVNPLEGFRYTLQGPDYRVFLNALQNDTRFKVLSTPRIFTSNNVKAEINVSQQVPYITSQQTAAIGGLITQYDFKNVGVVLNVTPRITAAGEVSMDVTQSADDLQGFTDFNAPIINHRQASTTATVKDGETIVLGGIIRNTTNLTEKKIPLLGDLPLIGNLFRSTNRSQGQTELMVLLTPRIVRTNAEAQRLRQEQTEKLSKASQDALNKLIPPKP